MQKEFQKQVMCGSNKPQMGIRLKVYTFII